MKARTWKEVRNFKDIPNIGPAMIADFKLLGINQPLDLKTKKPFDLYKQICKITKYRHDPCVLDTYIAAIDFMNGAQAKPWWHYTKERKKKYPEITKKV
jgi:hypothetical protein